MKLTPNALTVLEKRYLEKDEKGNVMEDAESLFRRVAKAIASAEAKFDPAADLQKHEDQFYQMMANLEFLPNSPTLMNAGRPLGQLSACFVLPVEDTMEGIFETIKQAAMIHKSGGGTGFSFSRIRPKGAAVNSTGGVASGPVSFMKVFNAATEAVKQGGTRRGANMGILRVDHPDIMSFITCKQDTSEITNFNISVGVTEKFMEAVHCEDDYDLIDPHTKKAVGRLNASEVFDLIVESAWATGEPGIIFLDRLNRDNVVPSIGEIESTNPCGEQPLLPYESCNLGSINLYQMTKKVNNKIFINYAKLERTVAAAVRFLDNVIEVNIYPIEEIAITTKRTRKIGLGVMGFADLLYAMGVPYGSEEAVTIAENVMERINKAAKSASAELAKERGEFELYDESIYKDHGMKLRNATVTTIAPTGTLSIIAGVSSGIEPVFALSYVRNVMDNTEMLEVNPVFKRIAEEQGFYSDELMRHIAERGSIHDIEQLPESIRRVFVTAHEISPLWHTRMQAAFQRHVDNAVSKTVNFPADATPADVREVFELSFKLGCKGVTIYRDGSRTQVLNLAAKSPEKPAEEIPEEPETSREIIPRPRPEVTTGFTEKIRIGCGNLYITANYDQDGICEVFTNTGRAGGCPSQSEASSRLISIALRSGISASVLVEQLRGIRCSSTIRQKGLAATSCPDAIGRVIEKVMKYQNNGAAALAAGALEPTVKDICGGCSNRECDGQSCSGSDGGKNAKYCPECGLIAEHEGGCIVCRNCGYSKCG